MSASVWIDGRVDSRVDQASLGELIVSLVGRGTVIHLLGDRLAGRSTRRRFS
jgi:hypothetical protein